MRAQFYGSDFIEEIPRIEQEPDLCIECGLGTRIKGGGSLDGGDLVAFNCNRRSANQIIGQLRKKADIPESLIRDL